MPDEIEHWKTQKTGILKFYDVSNVWFNLTLHEINLILHVFNRVSSGLNPILHKPSNESQK